MTKFRIESLITFIALIIAIAVIASGYMAWKSLSEIVGSIHQETIPDSRLYLLKDINSDLAAIENNVRLYILTDNESNVEANDSLQRDITEKTSELYKYTPPQHPSRALVDSFRFLTISKVKLWNGVLKLHQISKNQESEFNEIYEQLEEPRFDTLITVTEKKSILRRIFGTVKTLKDTSVQKRKIQQDEIREQIDLLQQKINSREEKVDLLESELIRRNVLLTQRINELVTLEERNEAAGLIQKSEEASRLAKITYNRLAGFLLAAVILLLLVIYILYNYLKKRRAYEKGLQSARKEAENLANAKEQFAANVSHEMRTPANAIFGLAEQLLKRKNNDNIDEQIAVLSKSANHLNQIINDTLDFTKIKSGKIRIENIHFSPKKLFNEIYIIEKFQADQKSIVLSFELEENLPAALIGDPLRLRQILLNIIGNAIKFTEQGEVTINVKSTKAEGKMVELKMKISDTGIGISENDQQIIFNEFVQAENSAGKKYRGTGLGLAIVKKLVELQGGTINLDSQPGIGTTFNITMQFPEGDEKLIEEDKTFSQIIPEKIRSLRILIADDEEYNRFVFKSIFNKWKLGFAEVNNGQEVVLEALNGEFDIVLMDVRMPKKNGIDAAKEILERKPETKIIAITATENKEEKQKCMEAGMVGFLSKPFSEDQLLAVIQSATDGDNKNTQKPAVISALEKLAGNDKKFLQEMITLFIHSTEKGINEISEAIHKKDWRNVSDVAHKIAPQCRQSGNQALYETFKELEKEALKELANSKRLEKLFGKIEKIISDINKELKKYLQTNDL